MQWWGGGRQNKTNIHFLVTLYLQRESKLFKESDAGGFEAQELGQMGLPRPSLCLASDSLSKYCSGVRCRYKSYTIPGGGRAEQNNLTTLVKLLIWFHLFIY